VYEVVQPQFEAGLEITRQALLHLKVPANEIQRFTDAVRHELYAPLYTPQAGYQTIAQLQHAHHLLQLSWVELADDSSLAGHTIGEAQIRTHSGASIVAILRNGALLPNPGPEQPLTAGDQLAALGNTAQIADFERMAHTPR
jgi:CPA2 family monovalent cation:H+ antiporter-2